MGKFIVLGFAIAGVWFVTPIFFPVVCSTVFMLGGFHVTWLFLLLIAVAWMGWKLKGK